MANPDILYDPDTGEYFSPDEFDPSKYELVDVVDGNYSSDNSNQDNQKDEAGLLEALGGGLESGFYGIGRSAGGLIQGAEDLLGTGTDFGKDTVERADNLLNQIRNEELNLQPGSTASRVYDVSSGILPTAGALAFSPLAGSSAGLATIGALGAENLGRRYADLRGAGGDPGESALGAAGSTAINTAMNALQVPRALAGTGYLRKLLELGVINTASTPISTAGELGIDSAVTGNQLSPDEFVDAVKTNTGNALLSTPLVAAVGNVANKRMGTTVDPGAFESNFQPDGPPTDGSNPPPNDGFSPPPNNDISPVENLIAKELPAPGQDTNPLPDQSFPTKEEVFQVLRDEGDMLSSQLNGEGGTTIKPDPVPEVKKPVQVDLDSLATKESFPDIKKALSQDTTQLTEVPAPEQVNLKADTVQDVEPPAPKQDLSSQRGAFVVPFADKLEGAITKAGNSVEAVKNIIKGRDPDFSPISDLESFMRGGRVDLAARYLGMQDNILPRAVKAFRTDMPYLQTLADRDVRAKQGLDNFRQYLADGNNVMFDAMDLMAPYKNIKNKANVDKLLIQAQDAAVAAREQGKVLPPLTPEMLQQKGYSKADIEGYFAVRRSLDYGLHVVQESLLKSADNIQSPEIKQQYVKDVMDYVNELKKNHYVPRSRFGAAARVIVKEGEATKYREHFDTLGEAKKLKKNLIKAGFSPNDIITEMIPPTDRDAYEHMVFEGAADPTLFNPSKYEQMAAQGVPVSGFGKHLIRAKNIAGFSTDIQRNVADYFHGLSNFYAKKNLDANHATLMKTVDPTVDTQLAARLNRQYEGLTTPGGASSQLVKFMNTLYLAGAPILAVTQAGTAIPFNYVEAMKNLQGSNYNPAKFVTGMGELVKSTTQASHYLLGTIGGQKGKGLKFAKANKDLMPFMQQAERDGHLGTAVVNEIMDMKNPMSKKGMLQQVYDFGMMPMAAGEKFQRTSGFITGLNVGKKNGYKGQELYKFATDFMYKVVPDPSRANKPTALMNDVGKFATLYKNYAGFQIRYLRDLMSAKNAPLLATALLGFVALGGTGAVPGIKDAERILESMGYNPRVAQREFFGKNADRAMYGAFAPEFDMSASVSTQEMLPEVDRSVFGTVGKTLTGPAGDFFLGKVPKAIDFYQQGKTRNAAEAIAPRGVRNILKAERLLRTGKLEDAGGFNPGVESTMGNALRLVMGVPPHEQVKAYEEKGNLYTMGKRASEQKTSINKRIKDAVKNNDEAALADIIQEAQKLGINPSPNFDEKDTIDEIISRAPPEIRAEMNRVRKLYD